MIDEKLAECWRVQADVLRGDCYKLNERIMRLDSENKVLKDSIIELSKLRDLWYGKCESYRKCNEKMIAALEQAVEITDRDANIRKVIAGILDGHKARKEVRR